MGGSIFSNPTVGARPKRPFVSHRKAQYIAAKAQSGSDRGRVVKHEQNMQIDLCEWIRDTFPGVHFRSDTGSGDFSSEWAKEIHNKQQSSTKLPDLTIFAMRRGYGALMLELKKEGTELKMRRDGKIIRIRTKKVPPTKKNPTGIKVLERDYKIRKKGDWSSLHVELQNDRMEELKRDGYCAGFAIGIEHAKKIICWYFDVPYTPPPENTELF